MKISIDTKEDSREDIKKAIRMLMSLVGESTGLYQEKPVSNQGNIFESGSSSESSEESTSEGSGVFGNLFGDDSTGSSETEAVESSQCDDDTKIEIIPY